MAKLKHVGCSVDGCEEKHGAKGYCLKHYEHFGRALKPGERVKKWRAANREKRLAQKRRNYHKNRESKLAKTRQWHADNVEHIKDYRKRIYKDTDKLSPEYRYKKMLDASRKRKHTVELTKEEFIEWHKSSSNRCEYCGDTLKQSAGYQIDRVDPNKGYIINNIVNCCKHCNYAKSDLTFEAFTEHITKIYENIKRKASEAK